MKADISIPKSNLKMGRIILISLFLLIFSAGYACSQELTIPYVFTPGNVISSFEMNENFEALADKANALDAVIGSISETGSLWDYNSGIITYEGGDVGVGTGSPVSLFTVAKEDGLANGPHILGTFYRGDGPGQNAGVSFGYYANGTNQTGGYIRAEDSLPLFIGTTAYSQILTITNDAVVGIGIPYPGTINDPDDGVRLEIMGPRDTQAQLIVRCNSGSTGIASGIELGFGSGHGARIMSNIQGGGGADLLFQTAPDSTSAYNTKMILERDGDVGIGTTTPGSYRLYVAGNAYTTGTWGTSDIRFKKNIDAIDSPLQKLTSLRGVKFDWKTDEYEERNFDADTHIGVIAQEVEEVFPELVHTDEDGYKAVAYDKLTVVLLEAIKEQQAQVEALEQRIRELEN